MKRSKQQNVVRAALSAKGYLQVNKFLAHKLGLQSAVMLAELVWQEEKAGDNGALDNSGYFKVCRDELIAETALSAKQQRAGEDILMEAKLIDRTIKVAGDVSSYKLNHSEITKFFEAL